MADLAPVRAEIKRRLSLAQYVGAHVKLTRKQREFSGLCPFHSEKSPSFAVVEDKGFYHCFGCGANGDVLKWHTEFLGMPFGEALRLLAKEAGVTLPARDQEDSQEGDPLQEHRRVMELACQYFQHQLAGSPADHYVLEQRGIAPEHVKGFRLGYSGNNDRRFLDQFSTKDRPLLIECGLARERGDQLLPFFYNRLMFPITDADDQVVAFGARRMGEEGPKYVNSPSTPLFEKGRVLYNYTGVLKNRKHIPIVVEGYMDVIAMVQAGFAATVAPLGTALTEEHMQLLWRSARKPLICTDGDQAGQRAAVRIANRALPLITAKHSLAFVPLPSGKDPDDLLRAQGAQGIQALLTQSVPLHRQYYEGVLEAYAPISSPEDQTAFEGELFQNTNLIADKSLRYHFRRALRDLLRLAEGRSGHSNVSFASGTGGAAFVDKPLQRDAMMLLLCTLHPTLGAEFFESLIDLEATEGNAEAFAEAFGLFGDHETCVEMQESLDSARKNTILDGQRRFEHVQRLREEYARVLLQYNLPDLAQWLQTNAAMLTKMGMLTDIEFAEAEAICNELIIHMRRQQFIDRCAPTSTDVADTPLTSSDLKLLKSYMDVLSTS